MSFSVYKSSAGSGKTFTLVKEYLKLILPEPGKYRNILAITFTNKAANEMKERVLFNLKELAKTSDKRDPKVSRDLLPKLIDETGLTEIEIITKSAEALKMIRKQPDLYKLLLALREFRWDFFKRWKDRVCLGKIELGCGT